MRKKSINLLPKSYYDSLAKEEKKSWISVWGFLAIFVIVALSSLLLIADAVIDNIYKSKLDEARNLYVKQQGLSLISSQANSVTTRSKAIDDISNSGFDYDATVQKLLLLQPKSNVSFRAFNSKDSKLEVTAIASDLRDIATFMNLVSSDANFKNPQLINLVPVNVSEKSTDSKVWQFSISVNS